jgi:hypothetical protein
MVERDLMGNVEESHCKDVRWLVKVEVEVVEVEVR